MNIITIDKLYFRYKDHFIFDDFHLDIKDGSWVTIAGKNASGKSTLVKLLAGLLPSHQSIKIDGLILNKENLSRIRKHIGFVFEHADHQFVGETVFDQLIFTLENLQCSREEMKKRVNEIATFFHIKDILEKRPEELSGGEKEKVIIASVLITRPKILVMDEGLAMLDEKDRKDIFLLLKKYNQEHSMTILNITHDLEDSYYSDRLIILEKGTIVMEGTPFEVLKHDRILNRLGIEMPFMIDLSNKLMFYGLIDHIIVDMDEMVGCIWK